MYIYTFDMTIGCDSQSIQIKRIQMNRHCSFYIVVCVLCRPWYCCLYAILTLILLFVCYLDLDIVAYVLFRSWGSMMSWSRILMLCSRRGTRCIRESSTATASSDSCKTRLIAVYGAITRSMSSIVITITWEYHDYDYDYDYKIYSCNRLRLHCKVITITIMITSFQI